MTPSELFHANMGLAGAISNDWFILGAEREDVRQEAMLALHVASLAYSAEFGVPFPAFAGMVIRRRLKSAVQSANTHRHRLLTDSRRMAPSSEDGDELDVVETIHAPHADVHRQAELRQDVRAIVACINNDLSPIERDATLRLLNGDDLRPKQVDNALWRARKKLAVVTS